MWITVYQKSSFFTPGNVHVEIECPTDALHQRGPTFITEVAEGKTELMEMHISHVQYSTVTASTGSVSTRSSRAGPGGRGEATAPGQLSPSVITFIVVGCVAVAGLVAAGIAVLAKKKYDKVHGNKLGDRADTDSYLPINEEAETPLLGEGSEL